MGWNNDYTLLTAPISLGDISRATGVGGPPYDLGNMIKNGTIINAMAKYKPVKSNNPGILTVTERAAKRYGMSEPSAACSWMAMVWMPGRCGSR